MAFLINILRKNKAILYLVSFFYNVIFSPSLLLFYLYGNGHIKGSFLKRVKIRTGNGGRVYIGPKTMMDHCRLSIFGENSILQIKGGGTNIHNSRFYIGLKEGKIKIDEGFTCEGAVFRAHEGKTIQIGEDCMFSEGIDLTTTDFHSILTRKDGSRINRAKDIRIGKHVWLGRNVSILKGTVIPENVIIGLGSIVAGDLKHKNSIYVGIPAKKVKDDITWCRPII